jgi:hypothetical protein
MIAIGTIAIAAASGTSLATPMFELITVPIRSEFPPPIRIGVM